MLSTKCAYVGFEKYIETILKVHELNSASANLESVSFNKQWYSLFALTLEGVVFGEKGM